MDWYPWGPEALDRARQTNRPIFLSIGYSACHWCHVMEHESFENPEIARILNDHFVSIKIDREERPDLDQIYMTAVQLMTGQGGWPMSMFLSPQLKPFYGGTYFPPEDHYGRPGFKRLLQAIVDAWDNRREELLQSSDQLTERVQAATRLEPGRSPLSADTIRSATNEIGRAFDRANGGLGSAPKFPHPMEIRLLLRAWRRFGEDDALQMARLTLDRMAMGGIYDHLGGGFHRYSTDERWLVPHFEKMLYDNALLTLAYLEGFQATGETLYREVVQQTLAYVRREMTSPEGPFYSTQDADSEGEEGRFYVWSNAEVEQLLGKDLADVVGYVYDISPEGNWERKNILHRAKSFAQDSRLLRLEETELRHILDKGRSILFEARSKRVWPGRDEKILTSWNGLMIAAFARAAQVLQDPSYAENAARAADYLLRHLRTGQGRLLRTASAGTEPKLNGYLEDYSFLIDGLIALYEATFAPRWLEAALELSEVMIDQFWDNQEGGFFFTGRDHEALIARNKDPHDSSIPSGNSMAVTALLRLAILTGRRPLLEKAEATMRLFSDLMSTRPLGAGQMLCALDFHLGPVTEVAIVGDPLQEPTHRVLQAIHGRFRPSQVIALKSVHDADKRLDALIPLLHEKEGRGEVTTYLCENYRCQEPLVGAEALEAAFARQSQ